MGNGIDFDALDAEVRKLRPAMDQLQGAVEQAADALLGPRVVDDVTRQDVIETAMLGVLGLPGFDARMAALRRRVEDGKL